jgi:hypothetical protein
LPTLELELNYPQDKFIFSKDKFVCIKGTWRCGKSMAGLIAANKECEENPNNLYLVIRKEWVDLRDSTLRDWGRWIGRPIDGNKDVIYENGSILMFRHGDDINSLKNTTLGGALMVQAEEMSEEDFWFLKGRLSRMEGTNQLRLDCNYDGHNWIYNLFNLQKIGTLILTNTFDNEKNLPADYIPGLKLLPKRLQDRFLYGSDAEMEGLVYDEFSEGRHVIEPFAIPEGWKKDLCVDHGLRNPTAVLWYAVDYDGNVICVSPETRLLTSGLDWIKAGDVQEGDELVGFDENVPETKKRRWKSSIVEKVDRIFQPSYTLYLSNGEKLNCSSNHQWLMEDLGGRRKWIKTKDIRIGWKFLKVSHTWEYDDSYGSGYLSAAFDGEGNLCCNKKKRFVMSFVQKDNVMLHQVKQELDKRGIRYGIYERPGNMRSIHITRKKDVIKLLGLIKPKRLMTKFKVDWLGGIHAFEMPHLVKKEFVGIKEVVSMKTSSGTYIAEGYASHNCYDEHYEAGKPVSYHSGEIKRRGLLKGICDPSLFNKNQSKGNYIYSIADEYRDYGIILSPAYRSQEEATINRVNEWFKADKIKIFKNCVNTIDEVCTWKWKALKPGVVRNDPEEPVDYKNHCCDDIKYIIASRCGAPTKQEPKPQPESLEFYIRQQEAREKDWRAKYKNN